MTGQLSKPFERYFSALELVADHPSGLTLVDIATRLDLPGATAHRVMGALLEARLVARGVSDRHFVLGPRARRFGAATLTSRTLEDRIGHIVDELSQRIGQTIYIVRMTRDAVESFIVREPVSGEAIVHPGRIMALHATATGKVMLAFQPPEVVEALLRTPLKRFTSDTKTEPDAIRAELAQVRAARFATCDNEMDGGVLSYATPIFSPDRSVNLALGVCGLKSRFAAFDRAKARDMLIAGAADIGRRIGGRS